MMKTGTQTGSLINHLYSRGTIGQPEPTVGMGATILGWTDRSPATITKVFKIGKLLAIEVQYDKYSRTDKNGMSECQEYEYTPNPDGGKSTYRFDGKFWSQVYFNTDTNRWKKSNTGGIRIGQRERYYDFSF